MIDGQGGQAGWSSPQFVENPRKLRSYERLPDRRVAPKLLCLMDHCSTAEMRVSNRRNDPFSGVKGRQLWFGGAKRDRTADLLHAMQALSQLSYGP